MRSMDAPDRRELWDELLRLRARVERLEVERGEAAAPERAVAEPPITFIQPARPSLESRLGSQFFNRIGLVALLIGAALFLKYAVDRQWLGAPARVAVGFAAGFGMIGWSERFRRGGFPVFAFSMKAAGTGILYLSLWAAFSLFHLVPYWLAFAGMVLVTAGNAWLCAVQQSEALAGVAAVGGFLTPALLGQNPSSLWTLGSYLLLLDAGLGSLIALRRWPRLLLAAFVGTQAYLVSSAWHGSRPGALFFAALFLVGSSLAGVWASSDGAARALARWIAFANALLGGWELGLCLSPGPWRWVPLLLAGWYGFLLVPRLRGQVAEVHAGLVMGFAVAGVWSLLSSGGVAAGWALEAAVLLLLTLRSGGLAVVRSPVPGAAMLLLAGAWLVWLSLFGSLRTAAPVVVNARFGLCLLVIAVAVLGVRLAGRRHALPGGDAGLLLAWRRMGEGSALLAALLSLLAGVLEIHGAGLGAAERFWDSAWAAALGVGLLLLGFGVRWAWLRWQGLGLLTLAVGKVFAFDTRALSQGFRIVSFLGLGVVLLLVSFVYQRDLLHLRGREHEG